ncbi:MAG TPA: AbrB/MazE/SpoVT family DNA-binding domain-containing protein [Thermoanaerobaculia bacterium]|nr:AbrB/MazE/SpoVT family DNA-binding domain-containing protein [Thermoanaerobaculia bacterium]
MATVTVSSKGQIVLPKRLREDLAIREGDRVELHREGDRIVLEPALKTGSQRSWRSWRGALAGSPALRDHLREHAEEVARERLP